jgi:hypothetical protein
MDNVILEAATVASQVLIKPQECHDLHVMFAITTCAIFAMNNTKVFQVIWYSRILYLILSLSFSLSLSLSLLLSLSLSLSLALALFCLLLFALFLKQKVKNSSDWD